MSLSMRLGLRLGSSLTAGVEEIITATLAPAMSTIYHGDAVQDVTNYATMVSTGNFSSTAGTISSAVVGFLGDAVDASTPLSDGTTAGFTVTVTDSAANERVFTASAIAITYAPPVAAGGLADQSYSANAAISAFDVSADFTGSGMTYALAPSSASLPAGLSLSSAGAITGTPTTEAAQVNIVVRGTNSGGFADTAFGITITAEATAAIVDSVTAGTFSGGALPISVTATGAATSDDVYWVIVPSGDTTPTATEVSLGQASGGGSPTDSGSDTWPGPFSDTLVSGIARANYKVAVVIDNGALSNVGVSSAVELDTVAPVLSLPIGAEDTGDADWSVTSNEATGTIYAALRLAATSQLSSAIIIAGTGTGLVDSDTDATPTADANNAGTFSSPAAGTYRVDIVQVDDYGNISNVVSTGDIVISASTPLSITQIGAVRSSTSTTTTAFSESVNFGAAKTGKRAIVVLSYGLAGGGTGVTVTFGGSAATVVVEQNQAIQANTGIYSFDVSAGGSFTVAISPVGAAWRSYELKIYTAEDHATITGYSTGQNGVALMDLSQSVTTGDEVVGAVAMATYVVSGSLTLVGLTRDGGSQGLNGDKENFFLEATADATETRTMTADPDGTGTNPISFSLAVVR